MIRYAITNGTYTPGAAAALAAAGVDFVQLRDKTSEAGALATVARSILGEIAGTATRLLINGRVDVAVAVGAAGVHLTAHPQELTVAQVRRVFAQSGAPVPTVSISCHTLEDAVRARDSGADLILLAPVFEKKVAGELVAEGMGLEILRQVCARVAPLRVLALGGVTASNAASCTEAGAAGIAGIRLFR